jgi:hydroxyethylthiazole kinase
LRLLRNLHISIIRANAAELASLAGLSAEVRGVESISASGLTEDVMRKFAATFGCTVAITGVIDVVSDANRTAHIRNGHEMLSRVVGTGCMSNVIVASFAAVQSDPFVAAIGGLTAFGISGEIAASTAPSKPGTFHMELYNALYGLQPQDIRSNAKIEMVAPSEDE